MNKNWIKWIKAQNNDKDKLAQLMLIMRLQDLTALDIKIEFETAGIENIGEIMSIASWR